MDNYQKNFYQSDNKSDQPAKEAYQDFGGQDESNFQKLINYHLNASDEAIKSQFGSQAEAAVVRILDLVMEQGVLHQASDIHFEPGSEETSIRFRVDGYLQPIITLPAYLHQSLICRIRIMSNLRIDEQRKPQDGRWLHQVREKHVNIRVSIIPTLHGPKVVMRILEDRLDDLSLANLGMNQQQQEQIADNLRRPHGLILVTGSTSSGKTTTLYSMIKRLTNKGLNITTIEDPIEYGIKGVNQIQTDPVANLDFASGLRAVLRQDPNVIMVGEIRDRETAALAVNAAMTGHLVLSTLHTNNAAAAIPRLLEMGIEPYLLASSLNLIIAQRLVRKVCSHCAIPDQDLIDKVAKQNKRTKAEIASEYRLKHGAGCDACFYTGYKGRLGIFEILPAADNIRRLIQSRASVAPINEAAKEMGVIDIFHQGLIRVRSGETTYAELKRVCEDY